MLQLFMMYERAKKETFEEVSRIVDICHDIEESDFPVTFGEGVESYEIVGECIWVHTAYKDSYENYEAHSSELLPVSILGKTEEATKAILTEHFLVKSIATYEKYIEDSKEAAEREGATIAQSIARLAELKERHETVYM